MRPATMPLPLHPTLADSKVVFARGINIPATPGCVIFNAPRPLLGGEVHCTDWCHGRFYAEVNLADPHAAALVSQNNALDARIVVPITDEEVVELLLIDNKYRERYREHSFEDQLHMLLPNLSKIQGRSYGEALALLDTAQAVLEADRAIEPLAIHGVAS